MTETLTQIPLYVHAPATEQSTTEPIWGCSTVESFSPLCSSVQMSFLVVALSCSGPSVTSFNSQTCLWWMWCLCGDAAALAPTSIPSVPPYHPTHCLKRRRRARASSLGPTPSDFVHICAGSASQFSLFVAHQPLRGSAWIRAARNSHFKVRASELG